MNDNVTITMYELVNEWNEGRCSSEKLREIKRTIRERLTEEYIETNIGILSTVHLWGCIIGDHLSDSFLVEMEMKGHQLIAGMDNTREVMYLRSGN